MKNRDLIAAIKDVLSIIDNNGFSIFVYEEEGKECGLELESWTYGGVDMIMFLDFRSRGNLFNIFDINKELIEKVNSFDVDEEIDVHRQDEQYKNDFTCRQSVEDFEAWEKTLNTLLEEVEIIVSKYRHLKNEDFENLGVTMKQILQ